MGGESLLLSSWVRRKEHYFVQNINEECFKGELYNGVVATLENGLLLNITAAVVCGLLYFYAEFGIGRHFEAFPALHFAPFRSPW